MSARARRRPTSALAARTRCNPGCPVRPGLPLGRPPRGGWRTQRRRDRSPGRRARCPRRVGSAWLVAMRACEQLCRCGYAAKCGRAPISRRASTLVIGSTCRGRAWVHERAECGCDLMVSDGIDAKVTRYGRQPHDHSWRFAPLRGSSPVDLSCAASSDDTGAAQPGGLRRAHARARRTAQSTPRRAGPAAARRPGLRKPGG